MLLFYILKPFKSEGLKVKPSLLSQVKVIRDILHKLYGCILSYLNKTLKFT